MSTVHLDICESNIKCNKHHDLIILYSTSCTRFFITLSILPYFKSIYFFQIDVFACGIFYSLKINLSPFLSVPHPSISRPSGQLILVNKCLLNLLYEQPSPFSELPWRLFISSLTFIFKLCNIVKFSPKRLKGIWKNIFKMMVL